MKNKSIHWTFDTFTAALTLAVLFSFGCSAPKQESKPFTYESFGLVRTNISGVELWYNPTNWP